MDRETLKTLLPHDKEDVERARALVRLGYPVVVPIQSGMIGWLKVLNSPVAGVMAEFFVAAGAPALPAVEKALNSRNDLLKYAIVANVVAHWPKDLVSPLGQTLQMLATGSTDYGTDVIALRLLAVHALTDDAWLRQWTVFKRKRHAEQLAQLADIEAILGGRNS